MLHDFLIYLFTFDVFKDTLHIRAATVFFKGLIYLHTFIIYNDTEILEMQPCIVKVY